MCSFRRKGQEGSCEELSSLLPAEGHTLNTGAGKDELVGAGRSCAADVAPGE